MQDKMKNIIVTIGFILIIMLIFFVNVIEPDKLISVSERRRLAQLPEITISKIINGDVTSKWEEYASDQFIKRDLFRTIKSLWSMNIFRQKDNNGLFVKDDSIYKIEYPLNEKNVDKSSNKIRQIYEKYLKDMNVYYAIIPDKNFYLQNDDHLKIDYEKAKKIIRNNLKDITYIDIWDNLELEDYYKTDLHWKQENLTEVVEKIRKDMGLETKNSIYTKEYVGDFYGTYYGQLGLDIKPDKMYILNNEELKKCKTYNYETKKWGTIYEKKNSIDQYDIYLSGATPLISIENENSKGNKELLLFRDSFGSSLAPLLVENYSKITLIDLRYISSTILDKYVNFENQDVLFLYSTVVLNQNVLK